jgi:hypothetical protein
MKKIIIVLMLAMVGNESIAFEDLQSTPHSYETKETTFLDIDSTTRNLYEEEDAQDIAEYDQAVTDEVTSPKISNAQAMATEMFGALLVHYISARETAREYLKDIKDTFTKWYHQIVKA